LSPVREYSELKILRFVSISIYEKLSDDILILRVALSELERLVIVVFIHPQVI